MISYPNFHITNQQVPLIDRDTQLILTNISTRIQDPSKLV